jgi:hypothetical protein
MPKPQNHILFSYSFNEKGEASKLDNSKVANELKNPYGSYRLKVYQSPATQCGSFETEEQYNEFKLNLNEDVDFLKGMMPSIENIVVAIWDRLEPFIENGKLHCIKLIETERNYVEYYGE